MINKLEVLNLALIVVLPLVIGYLSLQTNLEHGAGLSYLIHTHSRIVGTDLAVVYPFWSCCFSDSCTLYYITVYVCVGPRIWSQKTCSKAHKVTKVAILDCVAVSLPGFRILCSNSTFCF